VQVGSSQQLCRQNSTLHATVQQFPCLSTFGFHRNMVTFIQQKKKKKEKRKATNFSFLLLMF